MTRVQVLWKYKSSWVKRHVSDQHARNPFSHKLKEVLLGRRTLSHVKTWRMLNCWQYLSNVLIIREENTKKIRGETLVLNAHKITTFKCIFSNYTRVHLRCRIINKKTCTIWNLNASRMVKKLNSSTNFSLRLAVRSNSHCRWLYGISN